MYVCDTVPSLCGVLCACDVHVCGFRRIFARMTCSYSASMLNTMNIRIVLSVCGYEGRTSTHTGCTALVLVRVVPHILNICFTKQGTNVKVYCLRVLAGLWVAFYFLFYCNDPERLCTRVACFVHVSGNVVNVSELCTQYFVMILVLTTSPCWQTTCTRHMNVI